MLFILALESLQNLLEKAVRLKNPLHAIQWHTMDELYFSMTLSEFTLRISLYANDEAVFVNHGKKMRKCLKKCLQQLGKLRVYE